MCVVCGVGLRLGVVPDMTICLLAAADTAAVYLMLRSCRFHTLVCWIPNASSLTRPAGKSHGDVCCITFMDVVVCRAELRRVVSPCLHCTRTVSDHFGEGEHCLTCAVAWPYCNVFPCAPPLPLFWSNLSHHISYYDLSQTGVDQVEQADLLQVAHQCSI